MTAGQAATICLRLSVALILAGLMLATFVGAHRSGMVLSMLGLVACGGYFVALYLAWEHGD